MMMNKLSTGQLHPKELDAVYAISRMVAATVDVEQALDEIVRLSRPVFIFDSAILYLQNEDTGELEATFARAIGRGRSSEADLSWGSKAAKMVLQSGEIYLNEPDVDPEADRLGQGFYLGQPMLVGGQLIGALVFIRFGGPTYTEQQLLLAEFIAAHVTQVLEHKRLITKVAALEADKRLAELQSDFLATVSHELKTPLGFIKGYTTTLLRKGANWSTAEQRDFLNIINEESDQLEKLVNDLLDSSRLQSGNLPLQIQNTDLGQLCSAVIGRLRNRHPNAHIEFDEIKTNSHAWVDPNRFAQVIENLISNAVHHAPRSLITISIKAKEEKILVLITDEGLGISENHLERIFERFYRIPNQGTSVRGSGLGLYICKQIVEAHDGHIFVTSQLGEGSTFTIELPLQQEQIAL